MAKNIARPLEKTIQGALPAQPDEIEGLPIFSFTFVRADTCYARGNFPCHLIGHLMTTRDRFLITFFLFRLISRDQ